MLFRNLVLYRLPAGFSLSASRLEEALAARPLAEPGSFDLQTRGWIQAGPEQRLLYSHGQHHLLTLGIKQKLLPASIVNDEARTRAEALAAEQGYPVGRRQMRELKLRVADELRARALVRRRVVPGWLNLEAGWLAVDSASLPRAEEFTEVLRETLGSLAVTRISTLKAPAASMAAWLNAGDTPGRFAIDQDLELRSADGGATIRYARHALDGRDIKAHLAAGKVPSRLGLSWHERIAFLLNQDLHLKRVQFLDVYKDDNAQGESPEEQHAIDFALMTGELRQLVSELIQVLGGEETAKS
jgi:recombination associated protein RdgC